MGFFTNQNIVLDTTCQSKDPKFSGSNQNPSNASEKGTVILHFLLLVRLPAVLPVDGGRSCLCRQEGRISRGLCSHSTRYALQSVRVVRVVQQWAVAKTTGVTCSALFGFGHVTDESFQKNEFVM